MEISGKAGLHKRFTDDPPAHRIFDHQTLNSNSSATMGALEEALAFLECSESVNYAATARLFNYDDYVET